MLTWDESQTTNYNLWFSKKKSKKIPTMIFTIAKPYNSNDKTKIAFTRCNAHVFF